MLVYNRSTTTLCDMDKSSSAFLSGSTTMIHKSKSSSSLDKMDHPQQQLQDDNNNNNYPYPVKTVIINTCSTLYQKWSKTRKAMYSKALNGLTLKVEYADTIDMLNNNNNNNNSNNSSGNDVKFSNDDFDDQNQQPQQQQQQPITILALHGAPGSHEDFEPFIQYFGSKNIRFIAPNYPDFNLTIQTNCIFRHSAEEKMEFIKDFLDAINVNRIDLLLSHSSSIYPTSLLLCDETINKRIKINSVALFNPAGHRRIMAMRPAWFTEGSVKVYQNKIGRLIFKIFGKGFLKITGAVSVKPDSMNNVILSAQTMRYSNYKQLSKHLKKIKEMKTPTLWVCSENDKLIEKEIFHEMIEMMGAKDKNIQKYDADSKMVQQYHPDSHIRILFFNNGGHYAFLKHSDEVIKECDKFLNYVLNNQINQNNNQIPNNNPNQSSIITIPSITITTATNNNNNNNTIIENKTH